MRKVYVCRSVTRQLKPGDILIFYLSQSAQLTCSQCATSIGIVEKTERATSLIDLMRSVGRRSVYSQQDLTAMGASARSPVLVIDFLRAFGAAVDRARASGRLRQAQGRLGVRLLGPRMSPVIFVAGVSGVGKSRLLRAWVTSRPDAHVLSAGGIIGAARQRNDPEFLRSLSSEELTRSQQLLAGGFRQLRPTLKAGLILLDGHVLIEQPGGNLYEIPTQTFRELGVSGVLHLENEVTTIQTRRTGDTQRTRPLRSIQELQAYQQASRGRAQRMADELGVWIRVLSSDDAGGLAQASSSARCPAGP
jgi:adenylate kinase